MTRSNRTETRVRSDWNKLWIGMLFVFNLLMAWEALSLTYQANQLIKFSFSELCGQEERMADLCGYEVSMAASQRINEALLIWLGGVLLLAILVWATRPMAVIVQTAKVAQSMRTPAGSETPWATFAARLLGGVAFLMWLALATTVVHLKVPAPSEKHAAVAIGLWALGFVAFVLLVRATRSPPGEGRGAP